MYLLQTREHLEKWTMCAKEIVCEEEQQATQHSEFLGGLKISYSTPHRREAHTHTNLDQITHTRLLGTTPRHPHTHTVDQLNTRLYTHTVDELNTKLYTHTERNMFRPKKKIICSVQAWTNWGKTRLSRGLKDAQISFEIFLLSRLPPNKKKETQRTQHCELLFFLQKIEY